MTVRSLESADWILSEILNHRLENPDYPWELAQKRVKRTNWMKDKLVILAMDHPARRVVGASGNPFVMANRADVLHRILRILAVPGIDGLLATPDIIEDLFVLNQRLVKEGRENLLDDKVLIGSINRGGLAGTVFEMDDSPTGYLPDDILRMGLDGGKLLLRLDTQSVDSGKTLNYCVEMLRRLADCRLPTFLEPLAVPHSTDDLVKLVGVASALGGTSRRLWLKLPMADDFERVSRATTCPIVLLGGDNAVSTDEVVQKVAHSLDSGENVRGLMIGRSVMYPKNGDDPVEVAARLADCVHNRN